MKPHKKNTNVAMIPRSNSAEQLEKRLELLNEGTSLSAVQILVWEQNGNI
jgi:hypothetical protein